jgi:hypothetical protein
MYYNEALRTTVFVLLFGSHIWCSTSTSLNARLRARYAEADTASSDASAESDESMDSSRSQDFLEMSSEMETTALMKRVDDVQTLASTQRFAVQAQQQALLGLRREQQILSTRIAAFEEPSSAQDEGSGESEEAEESKTAEEATTKEATTKATTTEKTTTKPPSSKEEEQTSEELEKVKFLCSPVTSMPCGAWHGLGGDGDCKPFGEAQCNSEGKCVCKAGYCADGHGNCKSKEAARLLPQTYKMELFKELDNFLHMQKDDKALDFSMGDPGHHGHWHAVVNSDDSLMFYTKEWGPDHFMAIQQDLQHHFQDVKTEFTSPHDVSWEIYEDKKKLIYLKDIRTGMWLSVSKTLGSNAVIGVSGFPGASGALIFHPPLEDLEMMASAHHTRLWSLLPGMLFIHMMFL